MSDHNGIRVRFAPSPTGYLHVGGARTALFNWLFARHHGGAFVLRIEDTDRERSDEAMTAAILEGMSWLGLDWDEGPFHQADGLERHRSDARRLLDSGAAYRCFCTAAELDERRNAHPDGPGAFRYDGRCASIPPEDAAARARAGEAHALRFRVPEGRTAWEDAVHGEISFENVAIEDFIILRTDGTPIYNLAVVSDDIGMSITHVIRGDDHISNTPKQILLYVALGAAVPVFAHVPMILGPDGRRLSKRHGATAVGEYARQGILPEALFNFLALLGWSPGTDEEILSREELVRRFGLEGINRKSAIFDTQKLEWMNGRYLAEQPDERVGAMLAEAHPQHARRPQWWQELGALVKVRARNRDDLLALARPFVEAEVTYDEAAVAKHWKDPANLASRLDALAADLASVDPWTGEELERVVRARAEAEGVGAAKLIHPLRVALTGTGSSPGIFDVARLLGRETVLRRLDAAVEKLRQEAGSGRI